VAHDLTGPFRCAVRRCRFASFSKTWGSANDHEAGWDALFNWEGLVCLFVLFWDVIKDAP